MDSQSKTPGTGPDEGPGEPRAGSLSDYQVQLPGLGLTLRLGRLEQDLAGVARSDWPTPVAGFIDAALDTATAVAKIRFTNWAEAEPRVRLRVVARSEVGGGSVLARPLSDGLTLEVALAVADETAAVALVSWQHLAAWGTAPDVIWRAAAGNTRRTVRPKMATTDRAGLRLYLLSGDHWTTGVMCDVGYFLRALCPGPERPGGNGREAWICPLSPTSVMVAVAAVDWPRQRAEATIRGLAIGLSSTDPDPLPTGVFRTDLVQPGT